MKRASNMSLLLEICLRSLSMWPDSIYPNIRISIYMTAIAMFQYHQYAYVFAHFDRNDLSDLVNAFGVTTVHTLSFLKIAVLWWNRRTLCNILIEMTKDWREDINKSYSSITTKIAHLSRRCANRVIVIYLLAGFSMSVGVYVFQSMKTANNETSRELPIKMEFSFGVSKSPVFECILFAQFFYVMSIVTVAGTITALFAILVIHTGCQIDIMQQDIVDMSISNNMSLTVIKDVICKHQKIITFSDNIEKTFTAIALIQITWNTLIICCCGFLIIVANNDKDITVLCRSLIPGISKMLEVFVFCYAGEFLSAKSKSIADTVYESQWYNMSPSNCRVFLFVIIRSQRRLTVTAGKMIDLTLETFTNVMKTCGSYLSVLYAMY